MNSVSKRLLRGNYIKRDLQQKGKIIAEYVWIDGTGINIRSKARTLSEKILDGEQLPNWSFDGSSCFQAETNQSEIILKPVSFYPDPLRGGDNIIVMCSTYKWEDKENTSLIPANTNFRHFAEPILEKVKSHKPWFGLEQEYTLFEDINRFTKWPLGWPEGGFPENQGQYYGSVGTPNGFGRAVMDLHYSACLAADLDISGTNAEVMPGQWEYQIGASEGIKVSDQLWISRYLLSRITEDLSVGLSLEPKPIKGDWNGAGCHANFSTKEMREEGGFEVIIKAIKELEK